MVLVGSSPTLTIDSAEHTERYAHAVHPLRLVTITRPLCADDQIVGYLDRLSLLDEPTDEQEPACSDTQQVMAECVVHFYLFIRVSLLGFSQRD